MKHFYMAGTWLLAACGSFNLWAQSLDVQNPWARATVQGQKATGAFMTLTSKEGSKLVGVSTPVAGVAEVHEMKTDNGIMKMRAVNGGLDLPAGKAVALSPGGYHVMLMDLKLGLKADTTIPLTLVFKDAKGVETRVEVKVPVLLAPPANTGDHTHGAQTPG
jgi:copper(I)-binding protein